MDIDAELIAQLGSIRAANAYFLRFLSEHHDFTPADRKKFAEIADQIEQVWIDVSDRLPEPHTNFLALNRDGYIFESCMCYGMHEPWFTYPRGDGNPSNTAPDWIDVTYWMPKPALPEEG